MEAGSEEFHSIATPVRVEPLQKLKGINLGRTFFTIPRRTVTRYRGESFDVLKSLLRQRFSRGRFVSELEKEFIKLTGSPHAIATGSGRQAMLFTLKALDLELGDEVIVPAYTLQVLPDLIEENEWTPVFADINSLTLQADVNEIEKVRTERTRAVVVSHLFGGTCDIEAVSRYCREKNLFLIEDSAHALGAKFKGRMAGSFGDAAFYSFSNDKPICAFLGGMCLARDPGIAGRIRVQAEAVETSPRKLFGAIAIVCLEVLLSRRFFFFLFFLFKSITSGMIKTFKGTKKTLQSHSAGFCDLQAIVADKQLRNLSGMLEARKKNANRIREAAGASVQWQQTVEGVKPIYYKLILLAQDESAARSISEQLLENGIDNGYANFVLDYCPPALGDNGEYPGALSVYRRAVAVPNHSDLSDKDVGRIGKILKSIIDNVGPS